MLSAVAEFLSRVPGTAKIKNTKSWQSHWTSVVKPLDSEPQIASICLPVAVTACRPTFACNEKEKNCFANDSERVYPVHGVAGRAICSARFSFPTYYFVSVGAPECEARTPNVWQPEEPRANPKREGEYLKSVPPVIAFKSFFCKPAHPALPRRVALAALLYVKCKRNYVTNFAALPSLFFRYLVMCAAEWRSRRGEMHLAQSQPDWRHRGYFWRILCD